jgi:sugar lactone lactonase YvrE
MAGCEYLFNLRRLNSRRRSSHSTVVIALIALFLTATGVWSWRHAASGRSIPAVFAGASASAPALNAPSAPSSGLISLAGQEFPASDGVSGVVVGEFEGYFDAALRGFTVQPGRAPGAESRKDRRLNSRSDPGSDVPQGSGFGLIVVNSAFISTGDNPGTVSGEVAVYNNTTATLYNTRLVFTSFRICPASGACNNSTSTGDALNLPGATGLAFFNDGQVAYNNKLHVSRSYGDIPAGGNVKNIWTFATVAQPPRFFFTYKVIADLGVAAESVQPAAVQVNAVAGNSVVINGRGFTGTPTVELLPAAGSPIAMTGVTATATQITATVPANTTPGIYSVRVTNPGGVAGGQGSSTLSRKLTVTVAPSGGNILSGAISSFTGTGPFLISGNATIEASVAIPAGAVIYVSNGVTITVASGGNIVAQGGVPGISSIASGNPAQIVFTAQRSPGAGFAPVGSWGGINATSASTATMIMRNVVVEFGGSAANGAINLTGSGRTLRFTDSIARGSAGSGILANGQNDSLVGFARNRIDGNGVSSSNPAILVSGNAALGLFDIDTSAGGTSVGDASYYYSSANEFNNNQVNAIQIGTDTEVASNDFTKSGVLVGQGATPIRIRGNCGNPAIVGAAPPAPPAELTITATAIIQLAAEMAFQAGDYATGKVGCIAANGYAGAYLGAQAATSNKLIQIDRIPGGANFGAIFFTRNAMANCILNYTKVQNGGNGANCGLGAGEVLAEVVNVKVTNSQITDSSTGGLLATVGAKVNTKGTTFSGATPIIDTVAGGVLGDGNVGLKANMVTPVVAALDPLGRGVFIADLPSGISLLRFLNTTRNTVTIAGRRIPAGVITTLAGGGFDLSDNIPGRSADIGTVTGIGVSSNGEVVYFIDASGPAIRVFNASGGTRSFDGVNVGSGNVGTIFSGGEFGSSLNGLAVHPTTGDIYVADATPANNKVYRIPADGSADPDVEVGNGAATKAGDAFSPGNATQIPLLQPRALTFDPSGNLYVADTGHGRVIKVDTGGGASLMAQFTPDRNNLISPYQSPPHPSGLAFLNGKLYIANGNAQDILQVNSPGNVSTVAGTTDKQNPTSCAYSDVSDCGDGGPAAEANFSLIGSTGTPPLASIAADSKGIFVLDQGAIQRGRVRYINLSQTPVEVAGVVVAAGAIDTVAGSGLESPFDGGLATSAAFNGPTGVAVDPNGNLWITDTLSSKLRFANCGAGPFTIFPGTPSEQVVPSGAIVTVNRDVGSGQSDGVPVILGGFDTPQGLWATAEGVYVADSKRGGASGQRRTGLIRFINTSNQPVQFYTGAALIVVAPGEIKNIAGGGIDSGIGDTSGPGVGAPLLAKFLAPEDVAVAANGDMYIADAGQQRVRKVARSNGNVSSVIVGAANVNQYTGVSFDSAGRLLVADAEANAILRASNASNTSFSVILSGGLLKRPRDVAEGKDGALYVTNPGDVSPISAQNQKLLKITLNGATADASIFSGSITGYSGDGGPAASALLNLTPANINIATIGTAAPIRATVNILVTSSGEIIFTDSGNNAIRRIR